MKTKCCVLGNALTEGSRRSDFSIRKCPYHQGLVNQLSEWHPSIRIKIALLAICTYFRHKNNNDRITVHGYSRTDRCRDARPFPPAMNGSAEDEAPDRYGRPGVSAGGRYSPSVNDGKHPRRRTIIVTRLPALSGKIAKAALVSEPQKVGVRWVPRDDKLN